MPKIDISSGLKNIQDKLQDSTETIKQSVKDVKMPEINAESAKQAADNAKKTALNATENVKNVFKKKEEPEAVKNTNNPVLSTESAIKIIYYLMVADGKILDIEEKKFEELAKELDPHFAEKKDAIMQDCHRELDKVIDNDDEYDFLQDAVEKALLTSQPSIDAYITPKLLIWDLLTIAYSDGNANDNERRLIKHLVRRLDVDKALFLELESSMQTIMDIEKEINWIKTTDRPYLTIERMVNELNNRRNTVFEGVKDLVMI
ncbi:TerB family tellurite resistance protein [Catenisphaera adipataccumulans]|uniref:Putative tellurite resistance protein B-like protein n=1 Tax=Catenisphaera adipataccumulans TaxID=700500 RepID=A0A7W8FX70_9FIRM|nr:TerB family tellurite resistance protein [Catenisphaera adipataccumulans]MBB5182677.1 putative tellurite resistance protein B-like protein [Catenisphaera adipataccumulans]